MTGRLKFPTAFRFGGIFILCVNLWRYFHLMAAPILILWGQSQSKSLFLQPRHSHAMRKPTERRGEKEKEKRPDIMLIADEVDSQLTQSVDSFLKVQQGSAAPSV